MMEQTGKITLVSLRTLKRGISLFFNKMPKKQKTHRVKQTIKKVGLLP